MAVGMTGRARSAATLAVFAFAAADARAQSKPVGVFDGHGDVGTVTRSGSVIHYPASGVYRIAGSGQNMWGDRDDFHYVWKRLDGDFILTARGQFLGAGGDPHRKMGWIVRSSLETSSPHVAATVHGNGLTSLQFRRAQGGSTEEAALAARRA